jgi:DNA-binding transcriptional ArsR family regulator
MTSASLYEMKAALFRTLAHPARIQIVDALSDGEKSVGQLLPVIGVEASTLSQHLGVLRRFGLVIARREGHSVRYALASPEVAHLLRLARLVLAGVLTDQAGVLRELRIDAQAVGLAGRR